MEYNKEEYKLLKRRAKTLGVEFGIFTFENPEDYGYNGFTVAFVPAFDSEDCKMLEVSVSYCAMEDAFKKKHGKYHALRKLLNERELVQLPLAQYYRDCGAEDTANILLESFTV